METDRSVPQTIDEYIAPFPPEVREILEEIRRIVRAAAPEAREVISYRMPAFKGNGILLYFAAFKQHIGVYPPVRGDADLEAALAPYEGEKGNLRFPLDRPIPYDLIERIALLRVRQDEEKTGKKKTAKPSRKRE